MVTMRQFQLFVLVVFVLFLSTTSIDGERIRLSQTHPNQVLTHANNYQPPHTPNDIIKYGREQYELIESGQWSDFSATSVSGAVAIQDQLPYCEKCQLLIQVAEWIASNNSTMSLIEIVLDDLCEKLRPNSTHCPMIAAEIVTLVEKIPGLLVHVGLYEPIRACSFLGLCSVNCCTDNTTPNQVALGLGQNSSEIHVSWVTGDNSTDSIAYYGTDPSALDQTVSGYSLTYTEGGWLGVIHRVVLVELQPNQMYFFSVGSGSTVYNFTTWNDQDLVTPYTIGVVGDMGANDNEWSPINIAYLNAASTADLYQAIIHIGDISYADGYQASWDLFFNELQPTMSHIPYQVVPGNHELIFNFTAYKSRFFTSGLPATPVPDTSAGMAAVAPLSGTNLWASYDIGCVHFIALDSESVIDTAEIADNQLQWLKQDLAAIRDRMESAASDRSVDDTSCSVSAPTFLVVYLHRPLYCSDVDSDNCGLESVYLRSVLEDLFLAYGVDLVMYGHMHNYERTVPMYNSTPNAGGPIYVVHGAGGNREGIENNWSLAPVWSAIQASVVGVGELTILNSTTLSWNFVQQLNQSDVSPLENVKSIDQVYLFARDRTIQARLEREKMIDSKHAPKETESSSSEFTSSSSTLASSSSSYASKFISIADPSFFFSPYNWNWNVPFDPAASIYTQSNNPGSYIKLGFSGTNILLKLNMTNTPTDNYMTLRWSIDDLVYSTGTLPQDLEADGETLVLATGLAAGEHTLVLFILNSDQSVDRWVEPLNILRVTGVQIDAGAQLFPYPNLFTKNLLIYWDSIGEGININGEPNPSEPSDLLDNDSMRTWTLPLAESLQAEVGIVCFGGQGWIVPGSGYPIMNPNDTSATWAWSHFSSGQSRLQAGLLTPTPDYVFMGHGTNDWDEPSTLVETAVASWLPLIRAASSLDTNVFLTIPFGQYQNASIRAGYESYQTSVAGSDPNTHLIDLFNYQAQLGISHWNTIGNRYSIDGLHPLAWRSEQLGAFLATEATRLLTATAAADTRATSTSIHSNPIKPMKKPASKIILKEY